MKKRLLLIAALLSATLLAACGGGDDETLNQATSDLSSNVTASNSAAIQGIPFQFNSGVPDFGTTQTTTVTVTGTTGTNTFSIASGGNTATGNLQYGSCIFKITSSTFPVGSPLATGNTVTIAGCTMVYKIRGTPANAQGFARQAQWLLNNATSGNVTVTVSISAAGVVTVNATGVGSVALTPVTGGG